MPTVGCPHCRNRVEVDAQLAGVLVSCPYCNGRFKTSATAAPSIAKTNRPQDDSLDFLEELTSPQAPQSKSLAQYSESVPVSHQPVPVPPPTPQDAPLDFLSSRQTPATKQKRDVKATGSRLFSLILIAGFAAAAAIALAATLLYRSTFDDSPEGALLQSLDTVDQELEILHSVQTLKSMNSAGSKLLPMFAVTKESINRFCRADVAVRDALRNKYRQRIESIGLNMAAEFARIDSMRTKFSAELLEMTPSERTEYMKTMKSLGDQFEQLGR